MPNPSKNILCSLAMQHTTPRPALQASASSVQNSRLSCERRPSHIPQTQHLEADHYVLTLHTDARLHTMMSSLRLRYFPPHLLKVSAHITVFHALPGSELPAIRDDLSALCTLASPFRVRAAKPFRMSNGVGVNVEGLEPARKMRGRLRERWRRWLSEQDRMERWRGHYTVMNKEGDEERIERSLRELEESFEECEGMAMGLGLWKYDRGWWRREGVFKFEDRKEEKHR